MALTLTSVAHVAALDYDTVIDVRAPSEFAEDHLPGAINLPVLDDEERSRVGTIYKQQSPFLARKLGAALVARNAARHLEGTLADKPGGWRPLVYCWRGGQRSGSFATILSQVGWRTEIVEGGYKSWRQLVVEEVQNHAIRAPLVVLDGNTGSAKTDILARLSGHGLQTIDLEALANHRGSLFGAMPGGQPAQKAFEGRLALALAALDADRPVVVEAESSRIGEIALPKQIWAAIRNAPRVRINAPVNTRATYLAHAYADLTADAERLDTIVTKLKLSHSADTIETWRALARNGAFRDLAQALMTAHYDPRYEKHRGRHQPEHEAVIAVDDLSPAALDGIAARTAHAIATLTDRVT